MEPEYFAEPPPYYRLVLIIENEYGEQENGYLVKEITKYKALPELEQLMHEIGQREGWSLV